MATGTTCRNDDVGERKKGVFDRSERTTEDEIPFYILLYRSADAFWLSVNLLQHRVRECRLHRRIFRGGLLWHFSSLSKPCAQQGMPVETVQTQHMHDGLT